MRDPAPLNSGDFAGAMAAAGPFENRPRLAVAVSGGMDSMALCLLADGWARSRGGCVTALTVDHGLRPGARAEAEQVRRWLNGWGIEHRLLPWVGDKPATGLQQAARVARYALMSRWCRDAGVLHLLLGHHEQDQAETLLMRHCRGSGLDGLAGMAAVVETADVRLLRPLLTTSRERLRAVLSVSDQPWIEDPSNIDPAYTRNRIRALLPRLAESGDAVASIMAASARMARARPALDAAAAVLLARSGHLYPEGHARIDAASMASAPDTVATRALGWLLAAVGGRAHPPPVEKLDRVLANLVRGTSLDAATLGRCAMARDGGSIAVWREARGLPAPRAASADGPVAWDGRFLIELSSAGGAGAGEIRLVALGTSGVGQIDSDGRHCRPRVHPMPRQARAALPALADGDGIVSVPHLRYARGDTGCSPVRFRSVLFRPRHAPMGSGRYLA
jgi:tRNA(Ile)-lysidine synthase